MESIIGLSTCSLGYWLIQVAFVLLCIAATIVAVKRAQSDQELKLKYGGVNVSDSDVRYNNKKRLT